MGLFGYFVLVCNTNEGEQQTEREKDGAFWLIKLSQFLPCSELVIRFYHDLLDVSCVIIYEVNNLFTRVKHTRSFFSRLGCADYWNSMCCWWW